MERKMKKKLLVLPGIVFCFLLSHTGAIRAEEGGSSNTGPKEELRSDRQEIKTMHDEMKQDSQKARAEEKGLREQIRAAGAAGNTAKAEQLRAQLKSTHHENIQELKQEKKEIHEARKEFKQDRKEAREERKEKWESLTPEQKEKIKEHHRDRDNNPPGPKGGPGTNWENRPGPQGGPGASPDRERRRDRDNNPPGPRGGAGTNWENRPGPQGGLGASPNRRGVAGRRR